MDISTEWEQINVSQLSGTLLVVGAPDVGKSTFARYLYGRLRASLPCVAYLDGDPGQSSLGPPTTMTLTLIKSSCSRPLRHIRQVDVVGMHLSPAAQQRDPPTRKAYRARQFAQYFDNAQTITVNWSSVSVFPEPVFTLNRLVAMEDADGFTLGLGIVGQAATFGMHKGF
ncbi:MAG: Clp1/GlmU family protein [Pseudomonadota bacterium]